MPKIRKKKKVLWRNELAETDLGFSIGAEYGIRESREIRLNHLTNGGQRVASFYLFALDFKAAEIIKEHGGEPTFDPPMKSTSFEREFLENQAFLAACLDFERGCWTGLERENNRAIEFPRDGNEEEQENAIKMIAGIFPICNLLRLTAHSLAVSTEREIEDEEKNSPNGSGTDREQGGTASKKGSKSQGS